MIFSDAYQTLSNATIDTVGPTDTSILYHISRLSFLVQSIVTGLNKSWLEGDGKPVTIPGTNPPLSIPITANMNQDDMNAILNNSAVILSQLSQAQIMTLQTAIGACDWGGGDSGNQTKRLKSGQANTMFSIIQSTMQSETADPSSLAQQLVSNANQFAGQPAADVDIFNQGSAIWNTASSLTQSSF